MATSVARSPVSPVDVAEPRRRYGLAVLVLGVLAGLLVGYAAGVLTLRPEGMPGDTSPEAGFARDMTLHHAQAVDMGMIALARGSTPQVRNLGMDIALTQQSEIGMMQQWLRDWDLLPSGSQPLMAWMPGGEALVVDGRMPGMATQQQMAALREAEGTEFDLMFLDLMIDHHLGGVHMVDGVLELSEHPEVTWLASAMKGVQQVEVRDMQNLRDSLSP